MAAVYEALAEQLRTVGTDQFTARRQALTSALNTAYDELLRARSTATGLNWRRARLVAALNASHLIAEAATALGVTGTRPPPLVIEVVSRLGDAIRNGTPPPMIPPPWAVSRGAVPAGDGVRLLSEALREVSEAAATGEALKAPPELPDDETLKPVTEAIRALLGVFGTSQRLAGRGQRA